VLIGTQTWMAKNLNYNANGSICYDNNSGSCNTYGRLYDLATAKIVCPPGWHLPSDSEWTTLVNYAESNSGCTGCAGTKLKAMNDWSSGNGTDDYGFSALPGGFGLFNGNSGVGNFGYWWSAKDYDANSAYSRHMGYSAVSRNNRTVSRSNRNKSELFSVRCLQDNH
ncbi:MAG: hypothetical protein FWH22_04485, partial [Fibromonadales bacterium]|nr:hypothetical protein [Fibromonadales bacterium]